MIAMSNTQDPPPTPEKQPGNHAAKWHNIVVTVVAVISSLLLIGTLVYLGKNWDGLKDKSVQFYSRLLFGFWTLVPPILFWLEYHFLWRPNNRPDEGALFDRFKYSQETSSKIWLAVVAILAGFCWAGLDKDEGKTCLPATTCEQTQAVQKVLEQMQVLVKDTTSAAKDGKLSGEDLMVVAVALKRIDIYACPLDFREAVIRLAGSIEQSGHLMTKYPGKGILALRMGLSFLAGEKDAGGAGILKELEDALKEMRTRINELDALAVRHGARLLFD